MHHNRTSITVACACTGGHQYLIEKFPPTFPWTHYVDRLSIFHYRRILSLWKLDGSVGPIAPANSKRSVEVYISAIDFNRIFVKFDHFAPFPRESFICNVYVEIYKFYIRELMSWNPVYKRAGTTILSVWPVWMDVGPTSYGPDGNFTWYQIRLILNSHHASSECGARGP